jgi:F-type H+-transporting ATPase subunit b
MAESRPIEAVAQTGVVEMHHEPAAFGISAPGYVALSMLVVIALILWKKVPAMIGRMLDAKIATIRQDLDEAAKLRAEAEAQLAEAKTRNTASAGDAAAIVAHAEAEAKAMLAKAETDAAELVARRGKMAEDKISAAERLAIAEVRAHAADAAAKAAASIIAEKHDAAADKAVVDSTIAGLGRLN